VQELAESNRQVARKNAENETFVYSVSHDIRGPLVNLQGFSREVQLSLGDLRKLLNTASVPSDVREGAVNILDKDLSESLQFIQASVAHLSGIIDGLLRLSRAGRVEYQWQQVPVSDIVHRVVSSLSSMIAERGIEVRVDNLPPVCGDAGAIEQLFSNLISNALNYADPARRGVVHIGALPPDGSARVYFVRDNGLGLNENARSKLFQVFQRFHPAVGRGEGMGLAIVSRIVERHNGRIWVDSAAGQGTTFYIAFPDAAVAQ
jgi:signal transduction histidine kinase